ncbi:MAG: LD-carboxypeptidase [Euzebyales bacterium]|nr:LD-carboxypeptidase [Euzebyales bacterium]
MRVIAPSSSRAAIDDRWDPTALDRFSSWGIEVCFGAHADEVDDFGSSSVASRLADLHEAFADPEVDGILTVIGGYNANHLLDCIDDDLVRANPKMLCGYSDITVLLHRLLVGADPRRPFHEDMRQARLVVTRQ